MTADEAISSLEIEIHLSEQYGDTERIIPVKTLKGLLEALKDQKEELQDIYENGCTFGC